jgi:hypothetical protein
MSFTAPSTLFTTASSVNENNADVPGVTFCFTSSMNFVADPNVDDRRTHSAHRGADRSAQERYEEDQSEEHPPEGPAERTCAGRVVQLSRLLTTCASDCQSRVRTSALERAQTLGSG